MGVNFKVAIYAGFAGAIFFSVFPIIFDRKSFKEIMNIFIQLLVGFTLLGFITTFFIDTQQTPSPGRLKWRIEDKRNRGATFRYDKPQKRIIVNPDYL